jgi:predicted ATP-dependent endonuclease of OLD family
MAGDWKMLTKIKLENFTAFDKLAISFSKGINIFIGENGTGKTHILKALYSACDITKSKKGLAEKINDVFYPANKQIGRLTKRSKTSNKGFLEICRKIESIQEISIRLSITNHTITPDKAKVNGATKLWLDNPIESVFIPVKDMMANAPGFRSLYSTRNIHFEEVYSDIIDRAFLSPLKGSPERDRASLLDILQKSMDGKVISKNEEFFLKNKQGELEFTLLAEGYRKLGLLWLLIQNGTLLSGSTLFWDEPEANLNPTLMKSVVDILVKLQRLGVQIFVSTHDYILLKEFDLAITQTDQIQYHSLFRDRTTDKIAHSTCVAFNEISPNAIDDTFGSLIDRQISKDMGGLGR